MADSPSRLRRTVPLLLGAVALGVLAVFLARNWRHIVENYAPRPGAFALMAILVLAALALCGTAHRRIFVSTSFRACCTWIGAARPKTVRWVSTRSTK